MTVKGTKKSIIIYILLLLEVLETFFSLHYLRYYDEILAILGICFLLYKYLLGRIDKFSRIVLMPIIALCCIALLSNICFGLQNSWGDVVNDAFTFIKPFIIFLSIYKWTEKEDIYSLMKIWISTIRFLAILLGICIFIAYYFDTKLAIYDKWAMMPWLKEFIFFVGYPSTLAVFISAFIPILALDIRHKKNQICIGIFLVGMMLTQSGLGFLSIFLFLLLEFLFIFAKKIKWYHIILIAIGGSIVGYAEIKEYLLNSSAARSMLFRYAFISAKQFFPLGTGFSTYGGAVAAKSYSKLYLQYGFNKHWGMGVGDEGFFLNDSYFPMIMAQFGFIGTFIYVCIYYRLYKIINQLKSKQSKIAALYILLIIISTNIGQGGFSSNTGMLLLSNLALILNWSKYQNNAEEQLIGVNTNGR